MARVCVGNLAASVEKDDLLEVFSKYGRILDVSIATSPARFAYVKFDELDSASDAVRSLHGTEIKGQRVHIEMSVKRACVTTVVDCPDVQAKEIVVVVASKSKPKLEAAKSGFDRMLPSGCVLKIVGVDVPSGVAAQPVGMQETQLGARNRLAAARASEVGRSAHFCIAFEGGVEKDHTGRRVCFAVICIQFCGDDFVSETRSATHSLPPGIEVLLDEGVELGIATDRFFAEQLPPGYGKATGGTIGALTKGVVDRVEFYAHPATLALAPFVNAKVYGISTANPLAQALGDSTQHGTLDVPKKAQEC